MLKTKNNTTTISAKVPRIMSDKDLLKFLKVNMKEWRLLRVEYGKSEGYRKDRQVYWKVINGKVKSGSVKDSGKLLIEPMFSVKVFLESKVHEIDTRNEVELLKKQATSYAPKYKLIKRQKPKGGYMYEIMMPDLHLGRLIDSDETGYDASPDLFISRAEKSIDELLDIPYPIEKILFPIGNDFFNVNHIDNKTVHGTSQPEDPRWRRTYTLGKEMIIHKIETMTTIAPVEVLIVPGNHDETKIWYFGDSLRSWFHNNPNVTVDNRAVGKKVYRYGNVLILFSHYESPVKADTLLQSKAPELWAKTRYHEIHLGDKHHKIDTLVKTHELDNGVMVRVFRSLADPSVWEYDKGFDRSLHAAEGLLWHKDTGLKAQFTSKSN